MTTLTIKNLDDALQAQLRAAAESHDKAHEEKLRITLHSALAQRQQPAGLGDRIHQRFAALGGVELNLPPRNEPIRVVDLPG